MCPLCQRLFLLQQFKCIGSFPFSPFPLFPSSLLNLELRGYHSHFFNQSVSSRYLLNLALYGVVTLLLSFDTFHQSWAQAFKSFHSFLTISSHLYSPTHLKAQRKISLTFGLFIPSPVESHWLTIIILLGLRILYDNWTLKSVPVLWKYFDI